jgi:c-di-GMP-binding flagellar brake protein YcgR
MWSGIDKRCFPRANFECHVVVRRKDHPESFSTQTENIGAGGICVILDKGLELFTEVIVEIVFPDNQSPLINDGKAVWVIKEAGSNKRFDTGIEFIDLPEEQQKRIARIIENVLKGVYKKASVQKR